MPARGEHSVVATFGRVDTEFCLIRDDSSANQRDRITKAIWIRPSITLRDECLNVELFWLIDDAREKLEKWRLDYNTERPHSSLANLPAFAKELGQRNINQNREPLAIAYST